MPQKVNLNTWERLHDVLVNQAGFYGIPRREGIKRMHECLEWLGLREREGDLVRELSGGMKRRLMIARALVHRPKLLILDEPTAGVDIEIRHATWALLRNLNAAGTTVLLTTHYLEEAEALCEDVAIINHGRVVENGSVDALREAAVDQYILDLDTAIVHAPKVQGDLNVRLSETAGNWS